MEPVTRRMFMTTAGAAPLVAGLGAYVLSNDDDGAPPRFEPAEPARVALQRRHLPNVPLVTHEGERVRFYEDLVKDRKVVLTFVSSGAAAESATVRQNLAALQRAFGARVGKDLFLYSIARTPERDTPAVLADWAARSGAGPGWRFLTGAPGDVERLRRGLGFASDDPAEDADPAYAVGLVRYGAEPEMRWAHCQSQAPARVLEHSLLLDFGAGPPSPGSPVYERFGGAAGPGSAPIWRCSLLRA